jgi:EAL and modified HD-GYP domain-containing signal transduction protein
MGDDKPGELVRLPLVRARFCELLAEATNMEPVAGDLFLVGLLSLLEALLGVPMEEVLNGLPVDQEIKNTLRGLPSRFRGIFEVALDYETGTWEQLAESAQGIGLDEQCIPDLYSSALAWADSILSETLVPVAR